MTGLGSRRLWPRARRVLTEARDEATYVARTAEGASGDAETIARLKKLMDDADPAVAQAAIAATRSIQARM